MTIYNENLRNDNRQRYYEIVDSEGNYIQFNNHKNELDNKFWNSEPKAIELFGQTELGVSLIEKFRNIQIAEKLMNEIVEIPQPQPIEISSEMVIEAIETIVEEQIISEDATDNKIISFNKKNKRVSKKADTFLEEFVDEFNQIYS